MSDQRILVTGATGFIGSHVIRTLLRRGHQVRATRRSSSTLELVADLAGELEWVECDLASAETRELEQLAHGADLCIHCAWYAEPGQYQRSTANVDWVSNSLQLLAALAEGDCPRAVYLGTCFEYDHRFGYLSEETPCAPWTLYGSAKLSTFLMGERLAEDLDMGFAWVRLFYQYGPHEDPRRLVPHVIQALLRGEEAEVTSGEQIRDFLHVSDVADAIVDVALSDECGAVNVGSGRPVQVRQVVRSIARQLNAEDRVRLGAIPGRASDPPFICANNQRLVQKVGWRPRYGLDDGIQDAIEWWKRHNEPE